ncbi:MAG: sodium-dependent transporter [Fidelibacterota bacterium]
MPEQREHWASRMGFILAAAGSAIGLGNVWKFPYIAGENGGAAFVFVYLICIAVIGLPVLIAEVLMGRTTERNPVGAFKKLSGSRFWTGVGAVGVVAGLAILSFYSVVAGWSLGYIVESVRGAFYDLESSGAAGNHFIALTSNIPWIVGFHAMFFLVTMTVVYAGVQNGIERGSKIMMPVLFVLLIILVIRGLTLPGSEKGLAFLWNPDWSKISGQAVLIALGHAFFTLSLGMGAMMTYGSYMSRKDSIPGAALQIVALDTVIALLAGVAIFTAVFATGQDPATGPGLIFHTLPFVFSRMPGGYFFGALFFVLLTIAALTSAISLLEVVVAFFVDELKWLRHRAVLIVGGIAFSLGIPSALSFNAMADARLFGKTFFDLVDFLASNILLPLGGLFISVFVAWVWGLDRSIEKLKEGAEDLFARFRWRMDVWKTFLKYLSPILIFLVLLNSIGLLTRLIDWVFP